MQSFFSCTFSTPSLKLPISAPMEILQSKNNSQSFLAHRPLFPSFFRKWGWVSTLYMSSGLRWNYFLPWAEAVLWRGLIYQPSTEFGTPACLLWNLKKTLPHSPPTTWFYKFILKTATSSPIAQPILSEFKIWKKKYFQKHGNLKILEL
jgi:hypothetical protein